MTSPMFTNSVPVFKQMLTALKTIVSKAEAHSTAKSIEPGALLQARLYPDMFPLLKQVQIAAFRRAWRVSPFRPLKATSKALPIWMGC